MGEEQDSIGAEYSKRITRLEEELGELKTVLQKHKPLQKQLVEAKADLGKSKKQLLAAEGRLQAGHDAQRAAAAIIQREQDLVAQLQCTVAKAEAKVEGIEEEMREAAEADGGSDEEPDELDPDEENSKSFDQWLELEGGREALGKLPECFRKEALLRLTQARVPQPEDQDDVAPRRPGAFRRPSSKAAGAVPASVAGKDVPARAAATPAPPPAEPDPAARASGLGPTPARAVAKAGGALPAPPAAAAGGASACAAAGAAAGDEDVDLAGSDEEEHEAEGAPQKQRAKLAA